MSLPGNEDGGARHRVNHRQGPDDDGDPDRRPAPACSATALLGLDKNVYLVGTLDGVVYACTYDEPIKYTSRTAAHLGAIRSLEKSPYVDHVYLTTGCDCTVNVWAGDAFVEPVIALHSGRQIEQAVWSRTSSTVIVSLIGKSRTSEHVYTGVFTKVLSGMLWQHLRLFFNLKVWYVKSKLRNTAKQNRLEVL